MGQASVAYELSTLESGQQYAAYNEYLEKGGLSIEDVKRRKREAEEAEEAEEIRRRAKDAAVEETPDAEQEEPPDAPEPPTVEQEEKPPTPPTGNVYVRTEPTKMTTVPPDGKVVDFPAPPSPPPAPSAEVAPEPMHKRQVANILEELKMYCEECMGSLDCVEYETWIEWADALTVAIAALRK